MKKLGFLEKEKKKKAPLCQVGKFEQKLMAALLPPKKIK